VRLALRQKCKNIVQTYLAIFGSSNSRIREKDKEILWYKQLSSYLYKMALEDKTVILYWYKLPNELIKYQINENTSEDNFSGLERVNFTVGGDHCGGKFRMSYLYFHPRNPSLDCIR
jgi:hypothetical protein